MNKKIQLPKFNLQLFAEDNPEETPPTDEKIEDKEDRETKTFTQEDVNEIISKRLLRDRSKWEEDFKIKLEKEKEQAEELAKLSEKERNKVLLEQERKKFEDERMSFQKEKIELEVTQQLAEKSLPVEFANLLVSDTAETSFENISNFEKKWQDALSKAVDEKIKGTTPRGPGTKLGEDKPAQDFLTMANEASIRK